MTSQASHGLQFDEPPVFELGAPGRMGASLPAFDVRSGSENGVRRAVWTSGATAVSELEGFRHLRLSQWNFSIDTQFYPLGSYDEVQPQGEHGPRA
jgi:glycine dehydrogenase subunit 2